MEITSTSSEPALGWADALGEDTENPPTARVHGRELVEPDGKTHTVASCENRIKAQFELWVQNNALRAIAHVETDDPENYDKLMSTYVGDMGAGHYAWDGKYVRRARFESLPGIRHFLYLLMVRCNPEKTEEEVGRLIGKYPKQCGMLMNWALGNSQAPSENGAKTKKTGTT